MSKTVFEKITSSKEAFVEWLLGEKEPLELQSPEGTGVILINIGVDITLAECDGDCDACPSCDTCEYSDDDYDDADNMDEAECFEDEECFDDLPEEAQQQIRDALLTVLSAEVNDD